MASPPVEAIQLLRSVYYDLTAMSDLPAPLRERLCATAVVRSIEAVSVQQSAADGTRKFLFELPDGNRVESVLMQYDRRNTACVSSQVGCPLDCVFCETAKGGFRRNLTADRPDAFLPDLAMSLNNLSLCLADLGRR